MSTLVCVPINVIDHPSALADAALSRDLGADLVEFRVDQFFSGTPGATEEQDAVVRLVSESPLPCIVTCRPKGVEGGDYDGDEPSRIALFERLAIAVGEDEHPPRYLDVELATWERSANVRQKIKLAVDHPEQIRDLRTSLILSTHDFEGRPADLFRRLARLREDPAAAVHKVAYMARSLRDNLDLFDLLTEADRPTIALAMGRFGLLSRVLAPKFGGFLTFAALRPASTTAPGQPTVREVLELYRFRSIRPSTRVYGVVGFPIEHSMSPAMHNAGFDAVGAWKNDAGASAGGVYLPLPIPPEYEHFKATMLALLDHPRLTFSGCSVTIPHKEHLVRLAREQIAAGAAPDRAPWEIDRLSDLCGAANTLAIDRDAAGAALRCRVLNTDAPAAIASLESAMGPLAGKSIGVIGTGGVARAVAFGAVAANANVVILGRTPERRESLRQELFTAATKMGRPNAELCVRAADLESAPTMFCDAYVNCTPVGMKGGPAPDDSVISFGALAIACAEAGGALPVIMDTVYNPLETKLLADAHAAGCPTIDGLGMFIRQGESQFQAWTGTPPPAGLFEQVARRALAGHNSE